ncbi:hypothetical protein QJS10_CPB14g00863 [Acorus calamus]|uniref:Uncharacterized protein n=1 Tax=Acorus calamus TaxID=4465 RepID=A0AAV9D9P9_ACOCL|nr:hypothetical protein QJS10_CPB14g00863 [Acorus calamus]
MTSFSFNTSSFTSTANANATSSSSSSSSSNPNFFPSNPISFTFGCGSSPISGSRPPLLGSPFSSSPSPASPPFGVPSSAVPASTFTSPTAPFTVSSPFGVAPASSPFTGGASFPASSIFGSSSAAATLSSPTSFILSSTASTPLFSKTPTTSAPAWVFPITTSPLMSSPLFGNGSVASPVVASTGGGQTSLAFSVKAASPVAASLSSTVVTTSASAPSATTPPLPVFDVFPNFSLSTKSLSSTMGSTVSSSQPQFTTAAPSFAEVVEEKLVLQGSQEPQALKDGEIVDEVETQEATEPKPTSGRCASMQAPKNKTEEHKPFKSVVENSAHPVDHSREILGIPQNPHFEPLNIFTEKARQNLMAGWDKTFVEVAEEIKSLTADGFFDSVGGLRKSLAELEGLMGYDVGKLRKRLDELENIMEKNKECLQGVSNLKKRVEDEEEEIKRLEAEISLLRAKQVEEQACIDELMKKAKEKEEDLPIILESFQAMVLAPL